MPNFEKPPVAPAPEEELSLVDEESEEAVKEVGPVKTEPISSAETKPELPQPEPEPQPEQETVEDKRNNLQELLKKEKDLRDIILDIKERKTKGEDVSDMEEDKRKEEYKITAEEIRKTANEIAGKNVDEEAKQRAEKYFISRNQRRGESITQMEQRLIGEKLRDENYQEKCINRIIVGSDLSDEEKKILISGQKAKFAKIFLLGEEIAATPLDKEEAAGLIAANFNKEKIDSVKWPTLSLFFKIKLPGGKSFSEKEFHKYVRQNLGNKFQEQAKEEIEAEKKGAANRMAYKMYENLAKTGTLEGEKEEGKKEEPEDETEEQKSKEAKKLIKTEKEKKPEKPEAKPEISEENKQIMTANISFKIDGLAYNLYEDLVGPLISKGIKLPPRTSEQEIEYVLRRIDNIPEGGPEGIYKTQKEIKSLMGLRSSLLKENPPEESYYSAFEFFLNEANEVPKTVKKNYKKGDSLNWEQLSKITRELANKIAGKDLKREAEGELAEFLKKPKIEKQFKKELEEKLKNITVSKHKQAIKKQFEKQFKIRALRTLEEQKIKKLLKVF